MWGVLILGSLALGGILGGIAGLVGVALFWAFVAIWHVPDGL
jgi:hypothetical protein